MTQPTAQFDNYILPRLRNVAPIDNLLYDELGQAVLRTHNERFQGTAIADTTEYKKGQPIAHSNVPRALSYNQILHQLTKGRIHIASPADVVHFWDDIPERDATYADTNSIALFSNTGDNQDLAQKVFEILGRTSTEVPLLVADLGIEKVDTKYGFTFAQTELTKATEAPYLTQDGKVRYDSKTRSLVAVKADEKGVPVWILSNQSGLRRAYRKWGYNLNCRNDRLFFSDADARVQVVQADLKGRAA